MAFNVGVANFACMRKGQSYGVHPLWVEPFTQYRIKVIQPAKNCFLTKKSQLYLIPYCNIMENYHNKQICNLSLPTVPSK